MPEPRHQDGSKTSNRLRDIKNLNEAKYKEELSPAPNESTPDAEELEFERNLDYLLNNEELVNGTDNQTYVAATGANEIEISIVSQRDGRSGKLKPTKRTQRQINLSVADIIGDIGELEFSSDEEENLNTAAGMEPIDSSDGLKIKNKKKLKKNKGKKKSLKEIDDGMSEDLGKNANGSSKPKSTTDESASGAIMENASLQQHKPNLKTDKTKEASPKSSNRSSKAKTKERKVDEEQKSCGSKSDGESPIKKKSRNKKLKKREDFQEPTTVVTGVEPSQKSTEQPSESNNTKQSHEGSPKKNSKRKNKSPKKKLTSKNETNGENVQAPAKTASENTETVSNEQLSGFNDELIDSAHEKEKANEDTSKGEQINKKEHEIKPAPVVTPTKNKPRAHFDRENQTQPLSSNLAGAFKNSQNSNNTVSSLFGVTLKPLKLSSSKSEHLPELSPIKTIIGVSHQQILTADLSDVKLKTIMNAPSISKYAANCMKFAKKYENEVFNNYNLKKQFLTLCINVALYESNGFKKSVKKYPDILHNFGHYDELNLANTHTTITASERESHRNTLDYSVFAYFGHILIWALHLQRKATIALFISEYDISLSPNEIKMKIGGLHLWDRLFRELKGMNSKRWKHVLKFRNIFALEEDQFMVILRFMKITNIP